MMRQEISYVGKAKGDTVICKTLAKAFNVGVLHLHFLGTLIVPYMLTSLPASSSLVPKHGWGNQQGKYHDAFLGGQQPLIIMSSLFVLNPLTPVCWFLVPSHATATARKRAYFDQFQSAPVPKEQPYSAIRIPWTSLVLKSFLQRIPMFSLLLEPVPPLQIQKTQTHDSP